MVLYNKVFDYISNKLCGKCKVEVGGYYYFIFLSMFLRVFYLVGEYFVL